MSCKWGNLVIYTANTKLNSTIFFWVFLPARWRAMFQQSSPPLLEKWVPPGTRKPSYSNKRLGVRKGQEYSEHRWWKKSQTTTWDVQNLPNNGINMDKLISINFLSTGAGFFPSTVSVTFFTHPPQYATKMFPWCDLEVLAPTKWMDLELRNHRQGQQKSAKN